MRDASPSAVGREDELGVLRGFLEGATTTAALVIEGPAGIGKTTVLRAGVEIAQGLGMRVLSSAPLESDAGLSLAGLTDLLGEVGEEEAANLPGPQRRALLIALRREDAGADVVDPGTIAVGARNALRAAAERVPLLLTIDDLQWLDPPSLTVLSHALRRLGNERLLVLATFRRANAEAPPALGLPAERVRGIELGPLPAAGLREIVRRELGGGLPRPTLRRIEGLSGGNPFYALELARAHARGALPGTADAPLGAGALRRLVGDRLAGLPPTTLAALGTVAALAHPRRSVVARALEDEAALDAAFGAGILREDGQLLRFQHPLLGASAYAALAPRRRRELHARLAELVDEPEERGRHLAAAIEHPDAETARALDAAAAAAARRGAPGVAAELLEHGTALTPASDRAGAARRRLRAAQHHLEAGDSARSVELHRTLVAELEPGPLRAEALSMMALNDLVPAAQGIAAGRQAVEECGDERALEARCLLNLANRLMSAGDVRQAHAVATRGLGLARIAGDLETLRSALAVAGDLEVFLVPGGGRELLRESLVLEVGDEGVGGYYQPEARLGAAHLWADELAEARPLLEHAYRRGEEAGDEYGKAATSIELTELEVRAGAFARARRYADEALDILDQGQPDQALGGALYARALVAAHEGEVELARSLTARGLTLAAAVADAIFPLYHHWVNGFLALSLGDHAAALAELATLPDALDRIGFDEPGVCPCHADLLEALIMSGRFDDAGPLLERWQQLGDELQRPRVLAGAARARGLLAAARNDLDAALRVLPEACEHAERLAVPLERSRTELALGAVLRRAGQRRLGRATLEAALAGFEAIGARLWTERAHAELRRLGGRAASRGELTPTERRVAALVARGRTNREVADALFITVRTVEANLTRIYAKLDVRSRAELAARGLPDEP